jgi:molybdenum cofactor cytidylyltransferase
VFRLLGLVLAAGQSSRMGRPKALLTFPSSHETFVAHIIRTLRAGGVAELAVVGRPDDRALQNEVARHVPPVRFLENPTPQLGQLSSIVVGLAHAEAIDADGVMLLPVDIPSVEPKTVQALREAFEDGSPALVRATYRGRHGHPVIVARTIFGELRDADLSVGARAVFRRDPARVRQVEVDDPGILRDVDYPEDYARLRAPP